MPTLISNKKQFFINSSSVSYTSCSFSNSGIMSATQDAVRALFPCLYGLLDRSVVLLCRESVSIAEC